jgi:hypothetical protein
MSELNWIESDNRQLTAMDDPVDIIQVAQPLEHGHGDLADDLDVDGANALVYRVERALVHELHANADVRLGKVCAVRGDDVRRVAVVHDLQLEEDLLPFRWLRVDQHNLRRSVISGKAQMI